MQLVRVTCITKNYLGDAHIQVLDMILLPESAKPGSSNTEVGENRYISVFAPREDEDDKAEILC